MKKIQRAVTRTLVGTTLVLSAAACSDEFLQVTNPNVIDAATVDPTSAGNTLALSAQQNFATLSMKNLSKSFEVFTFWAPLNSMAGFRSNEPHSGGRMYDFL